MRFIGACSNCIFPLCCIRTPVEPVIVQEAAPNAPSSRPGSRNQNVQDPDFSMIDKFSRFRDSIHNGTRFQNIVENSNPVNIVETSHLLTTVDNQSNDRTTEQQTASDDVNAIVQNRRRFKFLRKLLCMKVPDREHDLTIDYVKDRDEDIIMQEKLEEAEILVQCDIIRWTAEEEMSEREAITNEENVKILQSNYKALVQQKASIQQELIKYQSYVETLKSEMPDIFVNDGHYLQTPLQRIEKARARYKGRLKSQVLPELDIANIKQDEPLSENVNTKGRLNITPEPTCSGKEDPAKFVPKLTIEGEEEPRLDEEVFDHNESVQAVWIQEPDAKKLTFKGHPISDPARRHEYDGDDESDGWNIPLSWLKEEHPGPSNVQRIRVKNESPNTDREMVRVLRSTSYSLSSPTPTPETADRMVCNNDEQHVEDAKEIVKGESTESRPESCDSTTTEELNKELEKTLVAFISNLLGNQEEEEEEDLAEVKDSDNDEEECPIYIGQIKDGVNTPERPVNLAPELQDCLSSPSKQTEEIPIEVYNTTSKSYVDSISSSIIDASVAAVNEANKRTITPRTVEAIKDMLANSERVVPRAQSQQNIRRVAFEVQPTLSNRSCDTLTLVDYISQLIGRKEPNSSDFEIESDNDNGSPTPTNSSSTLKDEEIYSNKVRSATATNENSSFMLKNEDISSDKNITSTSTILKDQDIKASHSTSQSKSSTSSEDRLIASNNDGPSVATEPPSQRVITPNTLQSIRQTLQDRARVIRQTRSLQTFARVASDIKRTISTTSRDFFSKFRRQNAVGIMPASANLS